MLSLVSGFMVLNHRFWLKDSGHRNLGNCWGGRSGTDDGSVEEGYEFCTHQRNCWCFTSGSVPRQKTKQTSKQTNKQKHRLGMSRTKRAWNEF